MNQSATDIEERIKNAGNIEFHYFCGFYVLQGPVRYYSPYGVRIAQEIVLKGWARTRLAALVRCQAFLIQYNALQREPENPR